MSTCPGRPSSEGIRFHRGINQLDGRAALAYVRQPSIPGVAGRALRQQVLLRAELHKVASICSPTR